MQPVLEPPADGEKYQRDGEGNEDDPPLPDFAGNADAGREPGAGGAGEPANPEMMFGADDDAGAEKTDAGQDLLDPLAGRIGNSCTVAGWIGQHHDHRGGKAYQAKRFRPIGLP